jgi:hypothetical protein
MKLLTIVEANLDRNSRFNIDIDARIFPKKGDVNQQELEPIVSIPLL